MKTKADEINATIVVESNEKRETDTAVASEEIANDETLSAIFGTLRLAETPQSSHANTTVSAEPNEIDPNESFMSANGTFSEAPESMDFSMAIEPTAQPIDEHNQSPTFPSTPMASKMIRQSTLLNETVPLAAHDAISMMVNETVSVGNNDISSESNATIEPSAQPIDEHNQSPTFPSTPTASRMMRQSTILDETVPLGTHDAMANEMVHTVNSDASFGPNAKIEPPEQSIDEHNQSSPLPSTTSTSKMLRQSTLLDETVPLTTPDAMVNETVSVCNNDVSFEPNATIELPAHSNDGHIQLTPFPSNPTAPGLIRQSTLQDETVPLATHDANSMMVNETVSVCNSEASFEPNATIILNANARQPVDETRMLSDETFCAPKSTGNGLRPTVNLNETVLVDAKLPAPNTTFLARRSMDAVNETFTQMTNASDETFALPKSIPKRVSYDRDFNRPMPIAESTTQCIDTSPNVDDDLFKVPSAPNAIALSGFGDTKHGTHESFDISDDDFQSGGMILNPSDFEFLLSKGETPKRNVCRDSILERFDPLTARKSVIHSIPFGTRLPQTRETNDTEQSLQSAIGATAAGAIDSGPNQLHKLEPVIEVAANVSANGNILILDSPELTCVEKRGADCDSPPTSSSDSFASASSDHLKSNSAATTTAIDGGPNQLHKLDPVIEVVVNVSANANILKLDSPELTCVEKRGADSPTTCSSDSYVTASFDHLKSNSVANAKMSVGLIHDMNNENIKSLEQVDIHDEPNLKMNDEKNVKHDFVEDIQRKLKETEAREELLVRRITDKDKAMNKMSAVMENYEKTMVEMITEREQITQNYEKQMMQLKAECDANFHHLTSLENTFSDLHAKYERSKQLTLEIKENETKLLEKLEFAQQQMKLQEQRYDKLKNHAFTQLECANAKLEALTKSHCNESKKLTAQLKKEEISRQSIMEQLAQKTKENEELVKICDELINNGPDGS